MLRCKIGGITCNCSLLFPAVLLLLLYHDPTGITLLGLAAAVIHECGHMVALLYLHEIPQNLTLSFYGMKLQFHDHTLLSPWKTSMIALAGPMMNFVFAGVLMTTGNYLMFTTVHLALGLINLLPILPMDGGQIINQILYRCCSHNTAQKIERIITSGMMVLMVGVCYINGILHQFNLSLILLIGYVFLSNLFYKGN